MKNKKSVYIILLTILVTGIGLVLFLTMGIPESKVDDTIMDALCWLAAILVAVPIIIVAKLWEADVS